MDPAAVGLNIREDVAYVTLDAPPYNILTCKLMRKCSAVLDQVAATSTLKAVAFKAHGKAFSAGADVGEHAPEKAAEMIATFGGLIRRLHALEIPIVMVVEGAALGGGFELVMMGDVVLATPGAKFGQPEIRLGFFAPVAVARLPRLVGPAKATEIVCSGRTYSADEMSNCGFVSRIVDEGEMETALEAWLDDFRQASPLIMRMNVGTLKRLENLSFEEAAKVAETSFLEDLMVTEDVREGIASFFEKRAPVWRNR